MFCLNDSVFLRRCEEYDPAAVERILREALTKTGLGEAELRGKKITVKPNLVMKMDPEKGGTTHPVMVAALSRILTGYGATVTIAESSGGLYTESSLRSVYRGCGLEKAAEEGGAMLNFDLSAREIPCPDGVKSKMFHLLTPILDCDLLINLCKIKTHGLTGMSCAVKNFFGTIPGVEKFEMHARFTESDDFENMLLDLCTLLHREKEVVNICDGVLGMEGNGPTGGEPKKLGVILCSRNPYALDLVGAHLIGMDGKVPMLQKAIERGYCAASYSEVPCIGDDPEALITPFAESDAHKKSKLQFFLTFGGGRFKKPFEPRPYINRKICVGCGDCVKSCPEKTIGWYKGNDKAGRKAEINPQHCIRCYCCQELCPHRAVEIHKNPILKLAGKLRF